MLLLLLLRSHFSRVRLCDPIDGSPPGSPIPGILQARALEWGAIAFSVGDRIVNFNSGERMGPNLWPSLEVIQ